MGLERSRSSKILNFREMRRENILFVTERRSLLGGFTFLSLFKPNLLPEITTKNFFRL